MRLATFDVYPKTLHEFRQRTLSGAVVSLVCSILIGLLTIIEVSDYLQVKVDDHLFVDTSRGQQLRINMNITFPALPCSVLTLDTLDVSGNHAANIMQNIRQYRLDANGNRLDDESPPPPSPRGQQRVHPTARRLLSEGDDDSDDEPSAMVDGHDQPIKLGKAGGFTGPGLLGKLGGGQAFSGGLITGENMLLSKLLSELLPGVFEDKEAIADLRRHVGEGCHLDGFMLVNKVAGNFHFALQKADHHVLMTVFRKRESLNMSHIVHSISFGEPYPNMVNPLDDTPKILHEGSGYFQYYLKIVPTIYENRDGTTLHTNQFSFTELFRTTHELEKLPAVFFHYELSPIMAKVTEGRRSFSSFLTGLCAIVGGVFTVAGMVDSCLFRMGKLAS